MSLLSEDKVERFRKTGIDVDNGAFGENILVTGIDPVSLVVGTKVRIGESLLEITQIGKECHTRCRIYNTVGDCIMPREGVFAKVLEGGSVKEAMPSMSTDKRYEVAVIIVSDVRTAAREKTSVPM